MNKIKFVYFDLGGVLISDFSETNKWTEMKKVMGVKPAFDKNFDELYNKYELEELCITTPVDNLIPVFEIRFNMKFPEKFSMLEYFVTHFERNESIWKAVETANKHFKIGILSNMYVGMLKDIKKKKLLPAVEWNIVIDSCDVRLQKPDLKIFRLAQEKAKVRDEEILFIDNRQNNIEAAKSINWNTFFYDSSMKEWASERLTQYLIGLI